ncbi:MAG: hypothetical protein ACI9LM_005034 [Alteromonadaceae bacterium]|jgi:uncharacterized protein (DUF1330 family)
MKTIKISYYIILICQLFFISACTTNALDVSVGDSQTSSADTVNKLDRLILKKGQILSFAMPITKPDKLNVVRDYYRRAFPLAKQFGLKIENSMQVTKTIVGDFKPKALVFFSWPDQASEHEFYQQPQWPDIKALRSSGWDELKIYSKVLEQDVDIEFSNDKVYTLAIAWFNPEHPTDYDKYMKGIENNVIDVGGKFLFKLRSTKLEALASTTRSPGQVTLVEWPDVQSLAKLQNTQEYKNNNRYFRSGVNLFEFHLLTPLNEANTEPSKIVKSIGKLP